MAIVDAASMSGQVDQEGDTQHNPFVARDASLEDKEIRQGRPGQENTASQRPEPGWEDPVIKSESEALLIRQPPEQNGCF